MHPFNIGFFGTQLSHWELLSFMKKDKKLQQSLPCPILSQTWDTYQFSSQVTPSFLCNSCCNVTDKLNSFCTSTFFEQTHPIFILFGCVFCSIGNEIFTVAIKNSTAIHATRDHGWLHFGGNSDWNSSIYYRLQIQSKFYTQKRLSNTWLYFLYKYLYFFADSEKTGAIVRHISPAHFLVVVIFFLCASIAHKQSYSHQKCSSGVWFVFFCPCT